MKHSKLIGLDLEEARNRAERSGYIIRETRRDGEAFLATCDYIDNRINVATESGKIIEILSIG